MVIEPLKHFTAQLVAEIGEGGDGHGALLKERLERRYRSSCSTKQVYFHLQQLERKGLLRSYGPEPADLRIYSITCLGWAALAVVRGQVFPLMKDGAVADDNEATVRGAAGRGAEGGLPHRISVGRRRLDTSVK